MTQGNGPKLAGRQVVLRSAIALAATLFCSAAYPQSDPKTVVSQATDALARMRSTPGMLGDRCALGVFLSDNEYVTVTHSAEARAKLQPGDRLLSVNGSAIHGQLAYFEVLGKIDPRAVVRVHLERAGRPLDLDVQCVNGRPITEARVRMLEAAKKKRWSECVTAIRDTEVLIGEATATLMGAYLECGFHANAYSRQHLPALGYEYWRLAIKEGRWDPITWPRVRGEALSRLSRWEGDGQARLAADIQNQINEVDRYLAGNAGSSERSSPGPEQASGGATGTGFLVDSSGTVVTSNHVVAGARSMTVRCGKGEAVPATVSSSNQAVDIAVLATGARGLPYLSLARPRTAAVGQRIFTYGFPVTEILGADPKFTDGTISALSGVGGEQTYLQISVPVQPGNSGGPVVNEKGEVVGVVAAAAAIAPFLKSTGTLPQNVNWAVKAEYASLMFDAPPSQALAASREAAIQRVAESVCFIEVH